MSEKEIVECDSEVHGYFARNHCGRPAVTKFVDDIDGTIVPVCKLHATAYRRNPKTWREEKVDKPKTIG